MKKIIVFLFILMLSIPSNIFATTLTAEQMTSTYVNGELGISVKIPHTWDYDTEGEVIEAGYDAAEALAAQVLGVSEEEIAEARKGGSQQGILIRMHVTSPALPTAQITTRSLVGVTNPPTSALENLTKYMAFVEGMTYITIIEPLEATELNGIPCAHVVYDTEIVLEGYTYLARYHVYSFWTPDRTIELTIIEDRNGAFQTQQEMDIATIVNSFQLQS